MSKILIEGNKVIIEGHANDLETCNTLTNLCDELSKSDKFMTVKYESGYGEFESISENKEKKFEIVIPPPPELGYQVNIQSNDGSTILAQNATISSVVVTSAGAQLKYEDTVNATYTYSGSKLFAGLATSANALVAEYKPGDTISIIDETTLYIVENIILPDSYSTLTALFSDIATVIREKTGDASAIVANDFPAMIRDRLRVIPPIPYLAFSSPNSFTLMVYDISKHWNGVLEYSTDASSWSAWDGSQLSSATSGSDNVLYLRGTGNTVITGNSPDHRWVLTGTDIKCIGNIENLLDYATVESGRHPTMISGCYLYMFQGCTSLTQAPELHATTLTDGCYEYMFQGCTSLTQAPELHATTLTDGCYDSMFQGCTSLTQAPALPATTLANNCYLYMFRNCTSLTQAPDLPATVLRESCYEYMFQGCTSLTQAPALPATTLATYCYHSMFQGCTSLKQAPALPATTLATYCYDSMFQGCTSLTQAPDLPATTLAIYCYYSMFSGCTSLTHAPALPAMTLADCCYSFMFKGCTSLIQAPFLPATTLAYRCYYAMFDGCTSLTQAPDLPATTLAQECYRSMFHKCTSLTKAPSELPATTLANSCYRFMFEFTAITAIPRIMATTYATDSCKGMFDDIKTLNVYSRSGPGHTYGWTAPASTYCSVMFGSDDGESEWAKLDGSNFPNSGTPREGVTYYFATVD